MDKGVVADSEVREERDVDSVPTVSVDIAVALDEDPDECWSVDGMGIVDVADGNGEENEPDIWSSLMVKRVMSVQAL